MPDCLDNTTINAAFAATVAAFPDRPFIAVPISGERGYLAEGYEITFAAAAEEVARLTALYRAAGYGVGHRAATLLENRPDYVLHKLALNALGVCCVPINPDYRAGETAYLLEHAEPDLILTLPERAGQIAEALAQSTHRPPVVTIDAFETTLTPPARRAESTTPGPETASAILYTSGTTGRPKGCVLSQGYEMSCGARYAALPGLAGLRPGEDRIYNPLPLYHANAASVSLTGAILTGCCHIQPDRFHPRRWWTEVGQTRATIVHYLGIIAPLLLNQPPVPEERSHQVRFGFGAGIEPQLHQTFQDRFGFPMVEVWGMTEMVRVLAASEEPRQVGTRAFGRAIPGIDVRVVDEHDQDVPDTTPGEMLIRHSAATPRRGFFSGYLKDEAATEAAWRGGWFHTGDSVWRDAGGMLHFIDRKKNIIRRAGENIAAAEIEAMLLTHPDVRQAAVLAVEDETREEEVLACVVLNRDRPAADAASDLFEHCFERMAYFKAPGWIHIVPSLPATGTQKIQKHMIYPKGTDPRTAPGIVDLRARKRRG